MMLLLGSLRAEERARGLHARTCRPAARTRLSGRRLVLRMSRGEIGSYLGLKLETVSRAFSGLQEDGVLEVRQRNVHVLDAEALGRLAHPVAG